MMAHDLSLNQVLVTEPPQSLCKGTQNEADAISGLFFPFQNKMLEKCGHWCTFYFDDN